MLSADYKERFYAEYKQLKLRYEKLKAFIRKINAAKMSDGKIAEPRHDCPVDLLSRQLHAMEVYLDTLDLRAVFEVVDLSE